MQPLETIKHGDFTIEIYHDSDANNPRSEFDHLGSMYYDNRRYAHRDEKLKSWHDAEDAIKHGVAIPVSAGEYGVHECDADDADGYIYVNRAEILKEYSCKRIATGTRKKVEEVLRSELIEFNQWINGEVCGFIIKDADGNELDSCWGCYGQDYCIQTAKDACPDLATVGTFAI